MAVTIDAVGPSSAGQAGAGVSSLTWTHVIASGATEILIHFSTSTGTPTVSSVTVGAGTASLVARSDINSTSGTDGWVYKYRLANPPSGSQTVTVTMSTTSDMEGGSISYLGSNGLGTAVIDHNATGTPGTDAHVSVSTGSSNSIVDMNAAAGSGFNTPGGGGATAPATLQWENNQNPNSAAGNGCGVTSPGTGGTVTPTITHNSDFWAAVGVEVLPAGGTPVVNEAYPGQTWRTKFQHKQLAWQPVNQFPAPIYVPQYAWPGQTWEENFHHRHVIPQTSATPVTVAGIESDIFVDSPAGGVGVSSVTGVTANISVDSPASPYAGATGPIIVSPAVAGQTWNRYFHHRQEIQPGPPLFIQGVTANISIDAFNAGIANNTTGVIANISVDAPAGSILVNEVEAAWGVAAQGTPILQSYFIVTQGDALLINVGDTFHIYENSALKEATTFTVTSLSVPFAGFVNVSFTPSAAALVTNSAGDTVRSINGPQIFVGSNPAFAGATGPNIVLPYLPGQTWQRYFKHRQEIQPGPPVFIQGVTANISVDAFADSVLDTSVGVTANISVDAPASPYAGATGPNIVSEAYPGQTWNRYFHHRLQIQPGPPVFVQGITANISVDSPAGTLLEEIPGAFANISVDAPSGIAGSIVTPVSQLAQPGATWRRYFQHKQDPVPGPPVFIQGVVANISVDSGAGTLTATTSGTVANISVDAPVPQFAGATGPNIVSEAYPGLVWRRYFQHKQEIQPVTQAGLSATATIIVDASGSSLSVSITGTTANIAVASSGTVTESVSATANITVAGVSGSLLDTIPGSVANINVASSGTVTESVTGITAQINVTAPPGTTSIGANVFISGVTSTISVDAQPGTPHRSLNIFGVSATISVDSSGSVLVNRFGVPAQIIVSSNAGLAGTLVITGTLDPLEWSGFFRGITTGVLNGSVWKGNILKP